MNELSDLPELSDEERAALYAVDMSTILGTPEERIRVCCDAALRFFRERNEAREAARWLFNDLHSRPEAAERWPWLLREDT